MTGFSLLLAGVLLLKMLSLRRVDAKCQLHPAGQLIWADCLLYCPGSVVRARHAKKSQNMGVNQNLGARQEFTVFTVFRAVYISATRHPIKNPQRQKMLTLISVFLLLIYCTFRGRHKDPLLPLEMCSNWRWEEG